MNRSDWSLLRVLSLALLVIAAIAVVTGVTW